LVVRIGFRVTFVVCGPLRLATVATVAVVLWTERRQREREGVEPFATA